MFQKFDEIHLMISRIRLQHYSSLRSVNTVFFHSLGSQPHVKKLGDDINANYTFSRTCHYHTSAPCVVHHCFVGFSLTFNVL